MGRTTPDRAPAYRPPAPPAPPRPVYGPGQPVTYDKPQPLVRCAYCGQDRLRPMDNRCIGCGAGLPMPAPVPRPVFPPNRRMKW